jgi:hypothetical protein
VADVVANNIVANLSKDRIRQLLVEWFATKQAAVVKFREETEPKNDPHDNYFVVYEACFEPSSPNQMRVEILVTTDGHVSVGIETRNRLANRLGVKNLREGFVVGHEPTAMTEKSLLAILDLICDGQLSISVNIWPWLGLGGTRPELLPQFQELLKSTGYDPNYLRGAGGGLTPFCKKHYVRYQPWVPKTGIS